MSVYQTGSVAGVVALLDTIRAFALANGATINNYSAEGSGQKLMLKLGNGFFNFRAYVNETQVGFAGAAQTYGLLGLGSTGFNGGLAWNLQPGAPSIPGIGTAYPAVGMVGLGSTGTPSPTITYHLFYVDRPNQPATFAVSNASNTNPVTITTTGAHRLATGDRVVISGVGGNAASNGTWEVTKTGANTFTIPVTGNGTYSGGGSVIQLCEAIYCIVEFPSGVYQRIGFGMLDKSEAGEVSGGQFMFGNSTYLHNVNQSSIHIAGRGLVFGIQNTNNAYGMVYATVDGHTGWKLWPGTNNVVQNSQEMLNDTIGRFRGTVNCAPNAINSQTVLQPIGFTVTRDGITNPYATTTPWTIIGFLPECYYSNIRNVAPSAAYTIGSTQYRAFPMYQKSDAAFNINLTPTQHLGLMIRSN